MWRGRADKFDMRDWFYPYYCGAGRGAREKYREVHGRWQKRVFRRPRLIYVVFAIPIAVLGLVDRANLLLWFLSLLLGLFLGAYVALVESPPARIENWRTGFEGERRTARALAPLCRRGCVLLHDLSDRRTNEQNHKGNIDHVVVSPAGVFLLDSKWLGGEASIDGDTVHVQMRDDDDDFYDLPNLARGMRGRAIRLRNDISRQTGVHFVQAVVVFWNGFEEKQVTSGNVVYVQGEHLLDWLGEQRPQANMTADHVERVASCINHVRPREHRAWWDRLSAFGLRGTDTLDQGATDRASHRPRGHRRDFPAI
jgi:hypothetical protein